jgi:hypothetical protein
VLVTLDGSSHSYNTEVSVDVIGSELVLPKSHSDVSKDSLSSGILVSADSVLSHSKSFISMVSSFSVISDVSSQSVVVASVTTEVIGVVSLVMVVGIFGGSSDLVLKEISELNELNGDGSVFGFISLVNSLERGEFDGEETFFDSDLVISEELDVDELSKFDVELDVVKIDVIEVCVCVFFRVVVFGIGSSDALDSLIVVILVQSLHNNSILTDITHEALKVFKYITTSHSLQVV